MLKEFVAKEFGKQIREKFPHLQRPAGVYAQVTAVHNGSVNLKILDKNKKIDKTYPEVPYVKTELSLRTGDIVVAMLLYGECILHIVGRAA